MTAATAPRVARPKRPSRSFVGPLAFLVFVVITWWAASEEYGLNFDIPELLTNLTRGADILAEFWPPDFSVVSRTIAPLLETVQIAVIASLIGCSLALPIAFLASRVTAPNLVVYILDRSILSVVRALPDVLYAIIFVAAVSIGPLPGILALILFNIAVVAKLLSETVDGVDQGPIEAARATGANRLLTVRWAVLPQVLPNYVAYSLYAFELNIRASAVLGIVGAGGIGNLINEFRRFFQYDALMVVVIEILVLVIIVEWISIWLRRRLV
ncbi:MAG: phosphonate ABC transporter, permease protein PhnE [Gemmatimonadaceae bacterium]|nr:phosphonate ABC transporter, permease protein PhnE [Gemmatimonadaceae bacterium]